MATITPAVCQTNCNVLGPALATATACFDASNPASAVPCSGNDSGDAVSPIITGCLFTLTAGGLSECSVTVTSAICENSKQEISPCKGNLAVVSATRTTSPAASSTSSQSTTGSKTSSPSATSQSATASAGTSQPTQSSTNPTKLKNGSGIGTGAAAGIGIGCAIAGAVLAGLIFLCFFMRYKKRNRQPAVSAYAQHVGHFSESNSHEKSPMVAVTSGVALVDNYLPQPAADDAISGDFSKLRDKIKDHVQSYYHLSAVNSQLVDQQRLQEVAAAVGIPALKMKELLLNPHSRLLVIRLYLAWLILYRCGGQGKAGSSFLPAEVASFAPLISRVDKGNAGQVALASKWKAISGTLLQSRWGPQHSGEEDVLEHSIQQAIAIGDSVLAPFVGSPLGAAADKRLQNLEGIMRRAAQFAILLFSQPSDWAFEWTAVSSASLQGRLVVFPGLLQTVTDEGQVQRPPRVLSEPEVVTGL